MVHLDHEIAIVIQLLLANVDKLRKVLPLHLLAFSVEVKPSVGKKLVLQSCMQLRKRIAYSFLGSFLVDEVNKVLGTILLTRFFKVHHGAYSRIFKVRVDFHWRRPLKVWFHSPKQRD